MSNEAPSEDGQERATDGGVLDRSARDADDRSDAVDAASILSDNTGAAASSESVSSESVSMSTAGRDRASETDASTERGETSDARVCWLDEEDAGEVIGALSSETARSMVTALQDQRQTASELAEQVDTSVQNVRHHLQNLQEAGLVEVAGTRYSVKGREMTVYAASEDQVVVAVGSEEESDSFFESLRGLLTGVTALAAGSGLVQWALGAPEAVTRVPDSTGGTASVIAGGSVVPPGLVFFAGGLLVVAVVVLAVNYR